MAEHKSGRKIIWLEKKVVAENDCGGCYLAHGLYYRD